MESLKNKEDDPTEEELDYMNKDKEKPMEHQLHHMKGNKKSTRQELDFIKNKVVSLQKEFDNFKHKALSRNTDPWSSSESKWARLAEEELYVREKEAAAKRTAADAALYVAQKAADAELYMKTKEAEGIKVVTEALKKTSIDDKTPPMHFKDYMSMMIKHGLFSPRETSNAFPPNEQTIPTDAGGEKNDTAKNTYETSNASPPNERTTISTDADGGKKNDTVKKTSETLSNASPPSEQTTTSTDAAGGKTNDTLTPQDPGASYPGT